MNILNKRNIKFDFLIQISRPISFTQDWEEEAISIFQTLIGSTKGNIQKMLESRPEDALVKLVKTVETVEIVDTVETVEFVETVETEETVKTLETVETGINQLTNRDVV